MTTQVTIATARRTRLARPASDPRLGAAPDHAAPHDDAALRPRRIVGRVDAYERRLARIRLKLRARVARLRNYPAEREMLSGAPRVIGSRDARTRFAELVRDALEGRDWLITEYGRPVAKLVSVVAGDLPLERRLRQLEEGSVIEPARDAAPADCGLVLYWDGSALLSVLYRDAKTAALRKRALEPGVHLMSTLALAEVQAAAARRGYPPGRRPKSPRAGASYATRAASAAAAAWALGRGPWRLTHASPSAARLPIGGGLDAIGAWHLAVARALHGQLPELRIQSASERMRRVAAEYGLAAVTP